MSIAVGHTYEAKEAPEERHQALLRPAGCSYCTEHASGWFQGTGREKSGGEAAGCKYLR
jgi:hypothetical protein